MPAAAGCATRSPATCTPWLSLRHDHDGAADRPAALVLVERFARLMHADPPSYYRADLALGREPEQISMDLIGHATSERIEAEAAHAWVHRRHPGQHDADYVHVADNKVSAECAAARRFLCTTGHRDDPRARGLGQLHPGSAKSASG